MNLFWILCSSLGIGGVSAYLAYRRGQNPYIWFFVGFIFGLLGVFAMFFAPLPRRKKNKQIIPIPEPKPFIEGPIDRFWYYLDGERQQQGPMSHNALTLAWKSGEIDTSTLIWHEELPNWKQLQDIIKYKI